MAERWIIGCERSQAITKELRKRGIIAYSCDVQPLYDQYSLFDEPVNKKWHIQEDIRKVIREGWDGAIFHPTCTFLTSSNTYINRGCSKYTPEEAIQLRKEAIEFFMFFTELDHIPKVGIENPVGIMSSLYRKPDQIIQPYEFGDNASKKTCLWLKGFPKLQPTNFINPTVINGRNVWGNQTYSGQNKLAPGPDRWQKRSKTYPGIAQAIADQWT